MPSCAREHLKTHLIRLLSLRLVDHGLGQVMLGVLKSSLVISAVLYGVQAQAGGEPITTRDEARVKLSQMAIRTCARLQSAGYENAEYEIVSEDYEKFEGIFRCVEGDEPDQTYFAKFPKNGSGASWQWLQMRRVGV